MKSLTVQFLVRVPSSFELSRSTTSILVGCNPIDLVWRFYVKVIWIAYPYQSAGVTIWVCHPKVFGRRVDFWTIDHVS